MAQFLASLMFSLTQVRKRNGKMITIANVLGILQLRSTTSLITPLVDSFTVTAHIPFITETKIVTTELIKFAANPRVFVGALIG